MCVRRLRTSWLAFLIAGTFLGAACHATKPVGDTAPVVVSPAPSPAAPSSRKTVVPTAPNDESADNAVDRVIAISIDGLNPRAIQKLGKSRTPTFHRLMREGAYTLNARTVREQTSTMPNHTAMLTGRRVDDRHGGHGYTENFDNGGTVHRAAGHYVASVFDVVHDNGGSTAMFASKAKFRLYRRTWNTHGADDRTGRNDGRAKIDRVTIDLNNTRLTAKVTAELRRSPREFTFVHLSLPDRVGHAHSFMGKQYLAAVQRTDRLLGRILSTVAARPALRRHTLVVLTADHGGRGAAHYNAEQAPELPDSLYGVGPGRCRRAQPLCPQP